MLKSKIELNQQQKGALQHIQPIRWGAKISQNIFLAAICWWTSLQLKFFEKVQLDDGMERGVARGAEATTENNWAVKTVFIVGYQKMGTIEEV